MARVTVEDCAEVVHSRFELVALAAQRVKKIAAGGEITVERDNDKNAVVALREIAARTVNIETLREDLIQNSQEKVNVDEYGVEEASDEMEGSEISAEAAEELAAFQQKGSSISDEDNIYGDEEMDLED